MATPYPITYFDDSFVGVEDAYVSVASSAVLYGLSVYTVFHVAYRDGEYYAFRIDKHFERLQNSCKIIGIDTFSRDWTESAFVDVIAELVRRNDPQKDVFARVSFHVADVLPGAKSRGLAAILSAFLYDAQGILPSTGTRLKTSVWRRNPDYAIPSRAKVNGAYVNSVLARQDALDSGYDDCIFLDTNGHVAELSAANLFMVREGVLVTPGTSTDILEGINRRTLLELARDLHIPTQERAIDLTELYIAEAVFACGTSAFLAEVATIDGRQFATEKSDIVGKLKSAYEDALTNPTSKYLTKL